MRQNLSEDCEDFVECAGCGEVLSLPPDPVYEWPDDGTPLMCWECQHEDRRRLLDRLERMELAVRAAYRLRRAVIQLRYSGHAEDMRTVAAAAKLLEEEG